MESVDRPTLLPPVGDFLRQVFSLGRRSIAPALPVLVLLYFYRFGMGLYLILSGGVTSPMGYPDEQLHAVTWIVSATAYLPLVVLIYTPFLPFQDAVLRGERRSFSDAVKHVLELVWPYGVSSILQTLFIALPAVVILVAAGAASLAMTAIPVEARPIVVLLAMIPAGMWIAFAMFLLAFATPLLVLDGRGPVQSIRESFALIRRQFGGLFWRFFVSLVVLMVAAVFVSLPSAMLKVMTSVAQQKLIAVDIARLVWDSAVGTLAFPFGVAVLVVLYRAVVPPAGPTLTMPATPDGAAPVPTEGKTVTTTSPYRFE